MATRTSTLAPSLSTDAIFRLWSQFIHDTIVTTGGWTDTAATGEVNLATMTAPGTNNTFAGYKVYAMADSLQGSYPCFLKIEYGRGNGANVTQIRVTVGTVHDGAGTLTGTQVFGPVAIGSAATSASVMNCWGAANSGRVAFTMFGDNSGNTYTWCVGVERTRDASGATSGAGIVVSLAGASGASAYKKTQVVPPSGGTPPTENRWLMGLSLTGASSVFNSIAPVGLLIPFAGAPMQLVINWGYINTTDYPSYASTIISTVYSTARTYLAIGSATYPNTVMGSTVNLGRLLMLYE